MTPRSRIAALAAVAALALATPLVAQTPPLLKTTELGKGPTLVFVHSMGGARMGWMPTARKLLGGYHVVMVDLPGHGDSPLPDPFSMDIGAAQLDQVLAKQKSESTIVVGHGLGGALAVLAAKQHPEHVRGVIVIDAALRSPFQQIPEQQRKYLIDYLGSATPEQFNEILKSMFVRLGRDSAQGVEIFAKASLVPIPTMKAYLEKLMYFDGSPALKDFKVPLLYVGSQRSWPDTTTWEMLAKERGYEGATVATHRIPNSGYLIMSDQPDSLAATIDAFAKSVLAKKP